MTPTYYYIKFSEYDMMTDGLIFRKTSHIEAFVNRYLFNVGLETTAKSLIKDGLLEIGEVEIYDPE
jgi:hypothetical protein